MFTIDRIVRGSLRSKTRLPLSLTRPMNSLKWRLTDRSIRSRRVLVCSVASISSRRNVQPVFHHSEISNNSFQHEVSFNRRCHHQRWPTYLDQRVHRTFKPLSLSIIPLPLGMCQHSNDVQDPMGFKRKSSTFNRCSFPNRLFLIDWACDWMPSLIMIILKSWIYPVNAMQSFEISMIISICHPVDVQRWFSKPSFHTRAIGLSLSRFLFSSLNFSQTCCIGVPFFKYFPSLWTRARLQRLEIQMIYLYVIRYSA